MQSNALQTFITIVETGSLVRASEQLHVTQSTVTMRLKALETEVGQRLLHRQKSGVVLTPAGTKLLSYAQVITGLWSQALMETGLPSGFSMICNVGCTPDLWPTAGKPLTNLVRTEHDEIALSIAIGSDSDLDSWITEGQVDICICYEPTARTHLSITSLGEENLVLYSDRPNTPTRFDPQYVYVDHGTMFRELHSKEYYDAGTARINFNSSTAALDHLIEHGGSAYLPQAMVVTHPKANALHEVADAAAYTRPYFLVVSDLQLKQFPELQQTLGDVSPTRE